MKRAINKEKVAFNEKVKKEPLKSLKECYGCIANLSKPRSFFINTSGDSILNGCEVKLSKKSKDTSFNYELELSATLPLDKVDFQIVDIRIALKSTETSLHLNPGAIASINMTLGDPRKLKGRIGAVHSVPTETINHHFLRLMVPVGKEPLTTRIHGTSYTDGSVIYGSGLARVKLKGSSYDIFRHKNKKTGKHFLVVDSLAQVDFSTFCKESGAILKGFSLICGDWYGGQRYILSSTSQHFTHITSIHFETDSASILSRYAIVDPFDFVQYMRAHGETLKISENSFPAEVLGNIATHILEDDELERALFLILEGNQTDSPTLKACAYIVAIETLSGIVAKNNEQYFKPFKNTETEDELRDKFGGILESFKSRMTDQEFEALKKKIDNLNTPSNMDRILKTFEFFKLKLPKEMIKVIKARNIFLHGQIPLEKDRLRSKSDDLIIISLKLHMLACTLLLKYCGYSGHIKNFAGLKVVNDNRHDPSFTIVDHVYYRI